MIPSPGVPAVLLAALSLFFMVGVLFAVSVAIQVVLTVLRAIGDAARRRAPTVRSWIVRRVSGGAAGGG